VYARLQGLDIGGRPIDEILALRTAHPVWDYAVKAREHAALTWRQWSPHRRPYGVQADICNYEDCCNHAAYLVETFQWPEQDQK
jgi:hypothetical protein